MANAEALSFAPLPSDSSVEDLAKEFQVALNADLTDAGKRLSGMELYHFTSEGYRYVNPAAIQVTGTDVQVRVKQVDEKIYELNITGLHSGYRWKRQVKILKDLAKEIAVVIPENTYRPKITIRLGTEPYYPQPKVDLNSFEDEDIENEVWLFTFGTKKGLLAQGLTIIKSKRVGRSWRHLVTIEEALAIGAYDSHIKTKEDAVIAAKRTCNYEATMYKKHIPYPEVYIENMSSHSTISREKAKAWLDEHNKEADKAAERKARQEEEHKKWEEEQKAKEKRRRIPKCPKCGAKMEKRNGRYGKFWGCSNYPECKGTRRRRK